MSDKLGREDESLINSVFERMEELNNEHNEKREKYLKALKEDKLKFMQKEINHLVGLFAYHGQFRGADALEELADYKEYEQRYFSSFPSSRC